MANLNFAIGDHAVNIPEVIIHFSSFATFKVDLFPVRILVLLYDRQQ